MKRVDIQQAVTDEIVASIERGGLLPWQCPWSDGMCIPSNWLTKQSYSGINIVLLWARLQEMAYGEDCWLTYKQAEAMGGQVRKGEKSVRCTFVKQLGNPDDSDETQEGDSEEQRKRPFIYKPFSLFNVEQIEGLESLPLSPEQPEYGETEAVEGINRIAKAYCDNSGVVVRNGGNQALYSPKVDTIRMPVSFNDGYGYAAVLAHELIHSTGNKKRLNRFKEQKESFQTFDESYAFEELVAELGAAFTCAELNIKACHDTHASYIETWLKDLKGDKTYIFKAASAASKAHQFLMNAGMPS